MKVGQRIKKIRELKNLKQEFVAQQIGLSTTAYGNIERGSTDITITRLEEIAKCLNVEINDIINFPESFHIENICNSQVGYGNYNESDMNKELISKMITTLEKLIQKL